MKIEFELSEKLGEVLNEVLDQSTNPITASELVKELVTNYLIQSKKALIEKELRNAT